MKLISIIAGAALLTGCGSLSDYSQSSSESSREYAQSAKDESCVSGFALFSKGKEYLCVDSKWVEADSEMIRKSNEEYAKKQAEKQAVEEAALKKALKGREKCMASFAKAIGIADDAHQVIRNDIFFEAKSIAYVQVAQELIASELPDLSLSYPQLQSVGYRNSEKFTEWRQKTGQKCSQALYYSQCMSANYLLELKAAEDELIKNCKRR